MSSIRFALRALAKTPVVSLVVVLSLALGIGANTAIFSLLYQVLLRSLPVQDADRLVTLKFPGEFKGGRNSTSGAGGMDYIFSYKMFRELERNQKGLAGVAAYRGFDANLALEGKTQSGSLVLVSGQYFPLLGVQPLIGRTLSPADDTSTGSPVAVLSYGFWNDRLGGRSDLLNKTIRINGHAFTVVGVAPRSFVGMAMGEEPDIYVPLIYKPQMTPGIDGTDKWDDYYLYSFGKLTKGASLEQAQSVLNSAYHAAVDLQVTTAMRRDAKFRQRFRESKIQLEPGSLGHGGERDQMRTPLIVLMVCTGLVLLIAAANAANLLLARAAQRGKELAIRAALGAGMRQLVMQLLTEALLLSMGGGIIGLLLSDWILRGLILSLSNNSDGANYTITSDLNPMVLLFTVVVSLVTGVLFGLYPAWTAARSSAAGTLKEEASNTSASRGGVRVRQALVCAQMAISVLLLIPMGLFLKSLVNLLHANLGFQTENMITFHISPELNGYTPERSRQLFEKAEQDLAAIPGVRNVTAGLVPLIGGSNWGTDLTVEGRQSGPDADNNSRFNAVGPGYFSKLGIPLISGREITDADTNASPKVAVVNETFARYFFKDLNAVGRTFRQGGSESKEPVITVVGVVKDSKYSSVRDDVPRLFFQAYRQSNDLGTLQIYVRTALPVEQVIPQVRRVMSSLDRDLPLENLRTLDDQISRNIQSERLVLELAVAFAVLATLLAMLGLYGVMAFNVARRTREIGVRMALGADSGRIGGLILREVAIILAIGSIIGVPAALGLARLIRTQLFGVETGDAAVVVGAVVLLTASALLAAYLPTRRATQISPVQALRYE